VWLEEKLFGGTISYQDGLIFLKKLELNVIPVYYVIVDNWIGSLFNPIPKIEPPKLVKTKLEPFQLIEKECFHK